MPRTLYSSIMAMASCSSSRLPSVLAMRRAYPCFQASSWAPWMIWPANGVVATPSATSPMNREVPLTRFLAIALGR